MTSDHRLDRRQLLKLGGIAGMGVAGIGIAGFKVGDRLGRAWSACAGFGDNEVVLASQVPLPQLFTTALPRLPT